MLQIILFHQCPEPPQEWDSFEVNKIRVKHYNKF